VCGAISHYNEKGEYSKVVDILPLCVFKVRFITCPTKILFSNSSADQSIKVFLIMFSVYLSIYYLLDCTETYLQFKEQGSFKLTSKTLAIVYKFMTFRLIHVPV
jgi:hypothetical protein